MKGTPPQATRWAGQTYKSGTQERHRTVEGATLTSQNDGGGGISGSGTAIEDSRDTRTHHEGATDAETEMHELAIRGAVGTVHEHADSRRRTPRRGPQKPLEG